MKKQPKRRIPLPKKPPKIERDKKKETDKMVCRNTNWVCDQCGNYWEPDIRECPECSRWVKT